MVTAAESSPEFATGALEFDAVRDELARHTSFSAGRERALTLVPSGELNEARRRQALTSEALKLPGLRPGLHLGGVHDVRLLAERARVGAVLGPEELLDVASTARGARLWRRSLQPLRDETPTLLELAEIYLGDHPGLVEDIQDAIGEGGEVLDSASPALGRIRGELRGAHDRLVTRLREIMGSAPWRDVVQDPVVTQRNGRYVIPIRADSRGQVPGIVHDQSASGATLFVEPLAVVEMANRWRTLILEEEREIERVLRVLSQEVGEQADALLSTVDGLAQIDLARAAAGLADQQRATAPVLVGLPRPAGQVVLKLVKARHPLLRGTVVPISLELGGDFDLLLITGPNTGGKTVALKTAGLLTVMAQAGLFIPADEGSLVAVFERVQADIGDEQSLQQSLSTFSSHISRIVRMLRDADSCSLILLDELGAGTDPQEGAAIARALLDFLRERGAYVIATTHYPELKSYAEGTPRVQNASVEFDIQTLSPTFRLMIGTPGRSNALAIAERLGMPREVLDSARGYVTPQARETEALLEEIARERHVAEDARARALKEAAEAATMKVRARASLREAEQKHREIWEGAQAAAEEELAELRREAHRVRLQLQSARERGATSDSARAAVEAALSVPSFKAPAAPVVPLAEAEVGDAARVEIGAEIVVPRLGLPGRVLSVRDDTVEVEVLGRRVRMPLRELEGATRSTSAQRRAAQPERTPTIALTSSRSRGEVSFQLDLRGLRRDEALERLETYLENASLAGMPEARIIHGKGTGAIRQAVREALRQSHYVTRFAPEPDGAGGDGATQVWLN
ncbi:MAG TPA: endonuclease MutS2 [Chloroflexota bacterium]|nr:endonuclease MutS2 [Chloroflexota bacterium]